MLPYIQTQNYVKHKENEMRRRADSHRLWQISREKYRIATFRHYNHLMAAVGRILMVWGFEMHKYYKGRSGVSNPLYERHEQI